MVSDRRGNGGMFLYMVQGLKCFQSTSEPFPRAFDSSKAAVCYCSYWHDNMYVQSALVTRRSAQRLWSAR